MQNVLPWNAGPTMYFLFLARNSKPSSRRWATRGGPATLSVKGIKMNKKLLTILVLVLTLSAYTAGQNRSAGETLEGLRDIGVVVKYGQVDGFSEATPMVLQKLQTRAEDRLSEAGVPILKGTNEADMANRSRLVLIITAKDYEGVWSSIDIESRLYERVRLLRDASKETELATWVYGGTGSAQRPSEDLLVRVFDSQLKYFIREYWDVNSTQSVVATPGLPSRVNDDANFLEGVNAIAVSVRFRRSIRPNPVQRPELEQKLKEEARSKLIQSGIRVAPNWAQPTQPPLLYVFITLNDRPISRSYPPPIEVESEFWQEVRHLRDLRKQTFAVTWEAENNNGGPITDDVVRQVMNEQLDEFIKAYKIANPNAPSMPVVKANTH